MALPSAARSLDLRLSAAQVSEMYPKLDRERERKKITTNTHYYYVLYYPSMTGCKAEKHAGKKRKRQRIVVASR